MNEYLGLFLLFVCGAGLVLVALNRLWWPVRPAAQLDDEEEGPADPLAPALAAQVPASDEGREELLQLLWAAGYYHKTALTEYLAIRAVLFLAPLLGAGVIALGVAPPAIAAVVITGLVLSLLGYSLPRLVLSSLAWGRGRRIKRGLPSAVDLLVLCLTAGQNLLAALEQTSLELRPTYPDLTQELRIVHQHARLHSLENALSQWADRSQIGEVRSLVLLLIQSERLGTDTVVTLNEFASNYRVSLRQRAEEQANRASFWMLFPTVFCLWIASAIILVGPAYLEFWRFRRDQMSRLVGNARNLVVRTDRSQPTPPAEETPASQLPFRPVRPVAPGTPGATPSTAPTSP